MVMVGNNDINDNSSVEVYKFFFCKVNETFKAKFPSDKLNIVPVLPRPHNERYNREASIVNETLQQ